jgi:CheY-like chemotaxis protein/chemotaxis signal transduction protein
MTWMDHADACSCVLLRLGERRFALAADQVAELASPSRIFRFAHKTPEIDGVILRRGRVVPVCDIAETLIGRKLTHRRFYLIATRRQPTGLDWIALPVSGECELIRADLTPAGPSDSAHVSAWLSHQGHRSAQPLRADSRRRPAYRASSPGSNAGGPAMLIPGKPAKILLIDSNVLFAKRLGDALKREGFEVTTTTQATFALTALEYNAPTAIVCATNMREMGALEIAQIIHADPKNNNLPIIATGDGSQGALMEAFQAGCDDYVDRHLSPGVIANHVKNIIISKVEGFQPTQMLGQADTSLSGNLTHHDLTGVMQMLGQARQTGALTINAGETDAVLFFDAGEIVHAECGSLFGDEAVLDILKSCVRCGSGVYKFVYGAATAQRTVLRSSTDLMLDAMREFDENANDQVNQLADKEAL